MTVEDDERGTSWWSSAVVYQLYVRSWRDSDGDGFGDLPGVIAKLDYLSWLGVDAVWLSPTMPSPDHDWGYDVSDYMSVHPGLGSLQDLDDLVAEAGRRHMRVLLDLVPNHTSDEHPWFVEARSSQDAAHRSWYVWAEPGPDGAPPNNWLDASGESAWSLDAATGQYYLHNFLPSQPDLNWWEPAVHDAFEEILRFWFDRGVAGLRIDVAHGLYKDAALRDNPPMPPGQLIGGNGGQEQRYSANRPETHSVFRNWRGIAEQYEPPKLLLGETCVPDVETLARYYGQDDGLQLAFNFPFMVSGFTASGLSKVVRETLGELPVGSVPVWTMSNHDRSRFTTRWCSGDDAKTALALTVLLTLPGTIVIYYGDEIGMTDVEVPLESQRDDMFLGGRGGHPSRDRAGRPCSGSRVPPAVSPLPAQRPGCRSATSRLTTWPTKRRTRDRCCPSVADSWRSAGGTSRTVTVATSRCPRRNTNGPTGSATSSWRRTSPRSPVISWDSRAFCSPRAVACDGRASPSEKPFT